ncbi:MAG: cytochrome c biogenesis protein ResB, partial [Nitrospirae bacterium]
MSEKKKSPIDLLWDFFSSIKLAVVLFALIASTSIVGTILEQGASAEKNVIVLKRLVGDSLAPQLYRILESLGFMDMYHSWWFVTFLVMFAANLIICSIDRLPRILKLVREPARPIKPGQLRSLGLKKEITLKGTPDKHHDHIMNSLRAFGFKVQNSPLESGGYQFYGQKGSWTRLGVYITHLSILIILAGAVIGIFFGFKGFLNLPEGYTSEVAYSRSGKPHSLGFSVRCDDFEVEFYGMSEMPKDYKSWLTVIDNGKEVVKKMIEVNEPLRYKGYTFYQSSYGMMPNAQGYLIFKVTGPGGKSETITKRVGESFIIPGTAITGTIKDFSPALATDQSGKTYTYSDMMNNPAAYISFTENGKEKYSGWVLKRFPRTWNLPDGNIIQFIDYWGAQYTGLQVRKDPGVWIVYLGCIIMGLGLYIAFFMNHRKIWVFAEENGKNTLITVAG